MNARPRARARSRRIPPIVFPLPMNRRWAASFWTAAVLWRFDNGREQIDGRNLAPGVSNIGSKSARGLAQSKSWRHFGSP